MIEATVKTIQQRAPDIQPKLAMILGSGLGALADTIQDKITIPYEDIPGFPKSHVQGHDGCLSLGHIHHVPVVCLQGRPHYYQGVDNDIFKLTIRTLKALGCEHLLLTNAAGSLHADYGPGRLMLIKDHINFLGRNPLMGPNDDEFGERFFPLNDAYDSTLRKGIISAAEKLDITLREGVYLAATGPCYETPAEIHAFRLLGADAVGMSTVPEVLVARHCGLKVAAISMITNLAAGLSNTPPNHDEVLECGAKASKNLQRLIMQWVEDLANEH